MWLMKNITDIWQKISTNTFVTTKKKKSPGAKSGHVKQLYFLSWLTKTEVIFTVHCEIKGGTFW